MIDRLLTLAAALLLAAPVAARPAAGDVGGFIYLGAGDLMGATLSVRLAPRAALTGGVGFNVTYLASARIDSRLGALYAVHQAPDHEWTLGASAVRALTGGGVCADSYPPQCAPAVGWGAEVTLGYTYRSGIGLHGSGSSVFGFRAELLVRGDLFDDAEPPYDPYLISPGLRLGVQFE